MVLGELREASREQITQLALSGPKLGVFCLFNLAYGVAKSKENPVGVGQGLSYVHAQ